MARPPSVTGWHYVSHSPRRRHCRRPPQAITQLHLDTCAALGVDAGTTAEVQRQLNELQQLLIGICIMQDLTARAKDSLVSFGERLSTRIFAAYLRTLVRPGARLRRLVSESFFGSACQPASLPPSRASWPGRFSAAR